jgi:hypothetical protein
MYLALMKIAQSYLERIKEAQLETKQLLKDVEAGKISKEQAADKIIVLRERIDSLFDLMHARIKGSI